MYQVTDLLSFVNSIEKLKYELRHSWQSSGRRESVAEHTWRMAVMAMVIAPHLKKKVKLERVLQMILIHDLPEAGAGDRAAWKKKRVDKYEVEKQALDEITTPLPAETKKLISELWEEFEECKTPEAQLAQAMDKMEAIIQHNQANIKTWRESEKEFTLWYGDEYCNFDPLIKELKDAVRQVTVEKIGYKL